jgi:cobalt-zinc-cadmium resistance protein CzcA
MIEKILRFSLLYPFAVIVLTVAVGAYGVLSFTRLPIDAVPDITNNQVQINITIPGFSPTQVEKQVTYVIETALSGIPGLEMTRSISRNSFSQVTAVFEEHVSIYFARQQISERLSEIKENLPQGADPKMGPISTGLGEVYMWTIDFKHPDGKGAKIKHGSPGWQSNGSYLTPEGQVLKTVVEKDSYLRTVQDWIVKPQLKGIQGLAGVDSIGGYVKQYHVEPNLDRMIALGLTFEDVINSLKKNNVSVGPGYIEKRGETFLIKSDERLDAPSQIERIVVATRDGIPIRINDIADVGIGKEMRTGSATKNGYEAVVGTAMMLIGANSRTVSQAVDERIKEINRTLPPDIEAVPVLNRTKLVNATISTVVDNLGEGAILVIAVLFLFLGHFKAAFITALVIPLSMLMTASGMVHSRISGNLMSLGAIDFGLIVDGAVIITENCLRRLTQKQTQLGRILEHNERIEELLIATKEMIKPTVFGQAIIIIVYFPLLTLSGIEGKMFHPMAITVILALISAFILSLTFIPAMIAAFVKGDHIKEKENTIMGTAKRLYRPILDKSVKFPVSTISFGAVIMTVSFAVFLQLGQEFVPVLDEQDLAMQAMKIPSTSLTQSTEMQTRVETAILKVPQVDYVFSKTGTAEMASDPMPPNLSDTFIMLKSREQWPDPYISKTALIELIEEKVSEVPGNNFEFTQPIEMRFNELISGVRSDVAVKIYGDDFVTMQKTADAIAHVLNQIRGSEDVKVDQTTGLPVLDVKIDREAASRIGVNVSDGLDVLAIAAGGGNAGQLFEGDRRFDIIVRLPETQREDLVALGNLPIPLVSHESPHGKKDIHYPHVLLGEIATLKVSEGLNEVKRENGKRFVAVQANVRNRDLGSYVEEAKKKIETEVKIPNGYWIEWGGQFENLISARNRLFIMVPICFSLIFLLLYSAFHSARYALLVFSGVPLALSGGIFALWVRDMPFSISAAVGFIALSGIAVLNGLVLLSFINQLMDETHDLDTSIKTGALTRLRPVLMTALVASLGFVPMAISTSTGSEVQKPLATVVIGGIISSTLLTLLVLPALYKIFSRRRKHEIPSPKEV